MTLPVSLIGVSDGLPPSGYRRQELQRKAWVSLKERATGNPSNVAGRKPEAKHWKTQEENTSLSGALCSAGKKHHLNNKTDNKGVILCEGIRHATEHCYTIYKGQKIFGRCGSVGAYTR